MQVCCLEIGVVLTLPTILVCFLSFFFARISDKNRFCRHGDQKSLGKKGIIVLSANIIYSVEMVTSRRNVILPFICCKYKGQFSKFLLICVGVYATSVVL